MTDGAAVGVECEQQRAQHTTLLHSGVGGECR